MSDAETEITRGSRLADFWIGRAVDEDSLTCGDCGKEVDFSDCQTKAGVFTRMETHAEEHHE